MKKYFLTLLLICITHISFAQYMQVIFMPYEDKQAIDSIVNEQKCEQYLIFQATIQGNRFVYSENDSLITSFLLWADKGILYVKMLTKHFIYATETISNDEIFNSKLIKDIWTEEKENQLLFAPPLLVPFNSDVVIFKTKTEKRFFEFGQVTLYIENPKKYERRKKFVELLKQNIYLLLEHFKVESNYIRPCIYNCD